MATPKFNPRDMNIRPDPKKVKGSNHTYTPRSGGKRGPGRPVDPVILGYVERFQQFKVGESFFVAGVKPSDIEFLRRPVISAGMGILIRAVQCDQIYKTAGVRIWRQKGPYDDDL